MSRFCSPSDFAGKYQISKNCYDDATLQLYIDKYEDYYLCKLFGADLFDEFIADLDVGNLPQTQKFLDIFLPFCKDLKGSSVSLWGWFDDCLIQSMGIPVMLKGFIYYHYVTAENVKHTITGLTKNLNENSSRASFEMIYRTAEIRFNESLESFINIQRCICDNLSDYPDFNGERITSKFYGIL